MTTGLDAIYTPKQQEIFTRCVNDDWFMLINSGAKRAGKTVLNNDLFLQELMAVRERANLLRIDTPQYILAGATLGTVFQNVLVELTNKYGIQFKFDKRGNFTLFGVYVVTCGHSTIGHLGKIRGMTSFGAYVNEGSLADPAVFDEIKSRCSGMGARVLVDTNPDHPEHWLLKDYMQSGADGILNYRFTLHDNTFLDPRYVKQIIETTPEGMFFDRNINGLWVSGDGVVYQNFNAKRHYIKEADLPNTISHYFAGVDWGYSHYGSIVVFGTDRQGKYYLLREYAKQFQEIDYWVDVANKVKEEFGNIPFYADTARPEHIERFRRERIKCYDADKSVIAGIETVEQLYKTDQLFIVEDRVEQFRQEIYMHVWDDKGEPIKENDDVLDAMRYALYNYIKPSKKRGGGIR